ncbi:MAG TPA: methyltransferase domain-containing protein [Candidatus Dormibacteraeota bacterium]|nr:methyltransferase domain-containing protein [Candidatus Dormibacteraeota bacterium]
MGMDRPEAQGSGTWGSREAAAEWRRGAAARLEALGPATEMMLDLAGVKTGSWVLDVGAGAGDSALMAARRARPTGHVLATDISTSMLEIAAESAGHDGLTNLSTRVADAQHLDLASDSFDAAISRNCLMLIPDYGRALTEIRRVLKPRGRFAAIVYSTPDRCPYLAIPHAIAFRLGRLTSPRLEEFGEFRLSAPGLLREAFSSVGFRDVTVHAVPIRRRFPSLSNAMQYARGPLPLRELMTRLSPSERDQAWAEIERALAQFVGPTGYDSPCEVLIGVGMK